MFIEVEENRFINISNIKEIMIDKAYKTVTCQLSDGETIESQFDKTGEFSAYVKDILKLIGKTDGVKKYEP